MDSYGQIIKICQIKKYVYIYMYVCILRENIVSQQLSIADNYLKITLLLKIHKTLLALPVKLSSKSDSEVQLTFHERRGGGS